jgi:drug/metabolite transporter (DMT)-like permease
MSSLGTAAVLTFPALALGLSGFETGVTVMPLVRGATDDAHDGPPRGRIRATQHLLAAAAVITSIPLAAIEAWQGAALWPTWQGWLLIIFIALGPSLLSQLMFMRGVQLIGPLRSGIFINLVPVVGPLFAVLILGETFAWHHGVALVLVLGGIWIAERGRHSN